MIKVYKNAINGLSSEIESVRLSKLSLFKTGKRLMFMPLLVVWLCSFHVQAQTSLGTSLLGASGGTCYNGNMGITFSLGETLVEHTSQATFGVLQHDPLGIPTVQVSEEELTNFNLFQNPNEGIFQLSGVPEAAGFEYEHLERQRSLPFASY